MAMYIIALFIIVILGAKLPFKYTLIKKICKYIKNGYSVLKLILMANKGI